MVLSLRYSDLSGTISESKKLSSELGQYCDELSRKVQQKMYSVEGGGSSALSSADYYVNAKIRQLRARENSARDLSVKTQTLLDVAKRVDESVKSGIEARRTDLFNKHPELKPSSFKQKVFNFFYDLKNANIPIISDLIRGAEEFLGALNTLCKEIRHWWECGGGKQLITNLVDIVVKVGLAVAAVITLVVSVVTGAALVVIVAAAVLAVIAVVNAVTNAFTSMQAIQSRKDDPAMSKIYGERDKLSDVLREENFGKDWNRLSYMGANALDITETMCEVVMLVNSLTKAYKYFQGSDLKRLFDANFRQRSSMGTFLPGKSSVWNATQSFTLKNWLLGGNQLPSNFSKLSSIKQLDSIGKLIKSGSKTLDGLNKVLKGDTKLWEFGASRLVDGFYTNLDTNKFLSNARKIIDKSGLTKLITDFDSSGTLSKINNSSKGVLQRVQDINKTLSWQNPLEKSIREISVNIPELTLDLGGIREKLAAIQAASTGFSRRLLPAFPQPKAFILPRINLQMQFEVRYPYYAISA